MTTVAVTGCSSRFAQALLPLLEADPAVDRIIGIDRVAPGGAYGKLTFHQVDVRDAGLDVLLGGCDALVHLAFIVGRPYSMPLAEAADINLRGTWNVCQAAAEGGARKLVISSSIAAYGILPDNPEYLVEDSPLRGLYTTFYYSQHKHANEIWLDGLQHEYPNLLISRLRPCVVTGPHQWAAAALRLDSNMYPTTAQARASRTQLVHEDDLAAAFHLVIQRDLPGAYNVVGEGPDSMPHLAEQAGMQVMEIPEEMLAQGAKQLWQSGASPFGPEWVAGEGRLLCANDKLKAAGWMPRYTTGQAFTATVAALRAGQA
jgi:UDP-glucose 4-epimerase